MDTVSDTVYLPGVVKLAEGFWSVDELLLPNDQLQLVMEASPVGVNCVPEIEPQPSSILAVKSAFSWADAVFPKKRKMKTTSILFKLIGT